MISMTFVCLLVLCQILRKLIDQLLETIMSDLGTYLNDFKNHLKWVDDE